MDFEIIFGFNGKGDKKAVLTSIDQILPLINQELCQWNNFDGSKDFNILIRKIENDTETLSINVGETIKAKDAFRSG